jgi:hypothetical protein
MIPVNINGINKGVYALEEHFEKQLLEGRSMREGPILKQDESGFWIVSGVKDTNGLAKDFPYYEASHVATFKKKKTLKNDVLKNQFIEGARLLTLFKNHFEDVEKIFDLKRLAKFYALMELGDVNHSFAWHNERFYFNPVIQKLELIGYDMIPSERMSQEINIFRQLKTNVNYAENNLEFVLVKNKKFKEYFLDYLIQFSSSEYVDSNLRNLSNEIEIAEKLIGSEVESFYFDDSIYVRRALLIRSKLSELDSTWNEFLKQDVNINDVLVHTEFTPNQNEFYAKEVSVNAYVNKLDSAKYLLELENYHLNDVSVLGYTIKGDSNIFFEAPIMMNAFKNLKSLDSVSVVTQFKPKQVLFEISNDKSIMRSKKVFNWKKPNGITSRMELANSFKKQSPYYSVNGNKVIFKSGRYKINKLLYIPDKYEVAVLAGTEINFVNGGGIIVNNSFVAEGNKSNPIKFKSEDGDNHGVTILNGEKVSLRYVDFDNLNSLHYKNWLLTGAVSVYEAEVNIKNCSITNNKSEDGLNIIRSNFKIDSLFVADTYSDGFDADFCTGTIKNSRFERTGNDCIDFSGSKIEITDIIILNSGDKGISGGERSELTITRINIDGAITGVAAKDDTKISGADVFVKNAEFGLAGFQKKPEYGKANINLDNVTFENLQQKGLLDLGSIAIINGVYFYGGMVVDIDKLYARFEK